MSEVTDFSTNNKEKLVSDMKVVVSDAEEILRATAGVAGEKVGELRERIIDRLRDAKVRIADAEEMLVDRTKAAARATDDYVNDNPWQAVGIAAGVGLLLGIIIRPPLMVAGFFCAVILMNVLGRLIGASFEMFIAGTSQAKVIGLTGTISMLVILGIVVIMTANKFFSLIHYLPEHVTNWIGQQFHSLGEKEDQSGVKGVFVGVFVQALQQAVALAGGQAVLVQERCAGLEGVGVLAVEDVGPVEAQGAVVGPLVAVEQQPFIQAQQQHVARGLVGAKHSI